MNYYTAEECEEAGLKTTRPSSPKSGDVYVDIPGGVTLVFFEDKWDILESADKTVTRFMTTKEKSDTDFSMARYMTPVVIPKWWLKELESRWKDLTEEIEDGNQNTTQSR